MSWFKQLKNSRVAKTDRNHFYGQKVNMDQLARSFEAALDRGFNYAVNDLGLKDVAIFFDNESTEGPLMYFEANQNIIGVTATGFLDYAKRVNALAREGGRFQLRLML